MFRAIHFSRSPHLVLTAIAGLVSALVFTSASATAKASADSSGAGQYAAGRYIVTFADDPAASYDGYVEGYPATRPQRGHKLNASDAKTKKWTGYLTRKHDSALAQVGAKKIYDFTLANNGVAVDLSAAQANKLAKAAGVLSLVKDELSQPTTTNSPAFLGLSSRGGLWSQLGGNQNAGAGLVVGIIDSGIWPENPSFAGGSGIPVPATWNGVCQAGEDFLATVCNDKLVGARFFVNGFGAGNIADEDFLSPRDGSGHGSHTASTAAGNNGVAVTIDGKPQGSASGMAPGAKVAAYKVCWEGKPGIQPGCFNSDSVAAINASIADGVDVLNYSIGGSSESTVLAPVAQAFRGASNAGIFVANSAGNSGPGPSTLDHPAPWVTTVAAATFRRAFQAVELGNGARYVGASTTPPLTTPAPLITAAAGKHDTAPLADANLCFDDTLDPAKVTGKIVICDRGVNARIDKSFEVQRAGGVGMVLVNLSPNSLNGDYHPVPAVHLDNVKGAAVKTYAGTGGATAKIVPLTTAELAAAPKVPEITDFSSRGPSTTTGGDILKPDIAAPGNDVVAAVAPPSNHGRDWDYMSGTSMSSPHIAGLGALIMAAHPTWLPSEIKSALMTTARDTVSSANDPFAQGAGFVNPNAAVDPGLVYPTTPNEYRSYMVSLGVLFNPPFDTLPPIDGPNLNQASIAVGSVPGTYTVTRHVRNVAGKKGVYKAAISVPGFTSKVTPDKLKLNAGQEATFTVTFTRTTAPLNQFAIGSLTWSDEGLGHRVRSPIALRPVALAAPAEIHADASASGSEDFSVQPGFTGTLASTVAGLVGVTPTADSVVAGNFDINNPVEDAATKKYSVVVPAGTKAARFSLDADDDNADLDLFVYVGGVLVALSASGAADEQATMLDPDPGTYDVYVNGFATPGGSSSYGIANFVVPNSAAGNATVSPASTPVTTGVPVTLTAAWTGLDPAQRWFGVISYAGLDDVTLWSVG